MLRKPQKSDRPSYLPTQIQKAEENLVHLIRKEVSILSGGNYMNKEVRAQTHAIKSLINFRQRLWDVVHEDLPVDKAKLQLEISIEECKKALSDLPVNQSRYRKVLRDPLEILQTTLDSFTHYQMLGEKRKVIISAETLYQAQSILFPAERMLITSGRREGGNVILGATFDVTGECSVGHVRADPDKLANALIAIDKSGAYLGLWSHSHPGIGKVATTPSFIDHEQYADWVKDYGSRLVAAIFVRDGYFRLWGDAIENKNVEIHMIGQGVKRIGDEQVYKFE